MSADDVNARVSAVREIGHGIGAYGHAVEGALAAARADLQRFGAMVDTAVAESGRALRQAEQRTEAAQLELARCRQDCEPLKAALSRARAAEGAARRVDDQRRAAKRRFDLTVADLLSSMRTASTGIEQNLGPARQHVLEYATALDAFLRTPMTGIG